MFFYGWWNFAFVGLILFSILFKYSAGLVLGRRDPGGSSAQLAGCVAVNLALLGYFKYVNFFVETGNVDPYTRNFIPALVAALRATGVEAVDLTTVFLRERDRGLYFLSDTHWNATGSAIAAREISRQVLAIERDSS